MQTAEKGVYSGALDVVRKTVAGEGLRKVGIEGHVEGELIMMLMENMFRGSMQGYQHRW